MSVELENNFLAFIFPRISARHLPKNVRILGKWTQFSPNSSPSSILCAVSQLIFCASWNLVSLPGPHVWRAHLDIDMPPLLPRLQPLPLPPSPQLDLLLDQRVRARVHQQMCEEVERPLLPMRLPLGLAISLSLISKCSRWVPWEFFNTLIWYSWRGILIFGWMFTKLILNSHSYKVPNSWFTENQQEKNQTLSTCRFQMKNVLKSSWLSLPFVFWNELLKLSRNNSSWNFVQLKIERWEMHRGTIYVYELSGISRTVWRLANGDSD